MKWTVKFGMLAIPIALISCSPPTPRATAAVKRPPTIRSIGPQLESSTTATIPRGPDSWPKAIEPAHADDRLADLRYLRLVRGDHRKKILALTFDDGPHAKSTLALLKVLASTHTKATFFVIGKQVEKYPDLVKQEVLQGHEIGNHTFDHVNLTQIPPELIGYELDQCNRAIKKACGVQSRYFRPPGGDYNKDVLIAATHRGYVTTLWTDDPGDYAKPGADVVLERGLDHLENGGVVLLHDGILETLNVLPAFIAEARRRGYEFVTVSELERQLKATGDTGSDIMPTSKGSGF